MGFGDGLTRFGGEDGLSVLQSDVGFIALWLVLHAIFDNLVAQRIFSRDGKGRWFCIHAAGNACVSILSAADAIGSILQPLTTGEGESSVMQPIYIVAAIHMYHCLAFSDLRREDWVHHIVFGGSICSLGLTFHVGRGLNLIAFFVCGLPGGLDYFLLCLVRLNKIDQNSEKRWNARVMTWIRAPGCTVIAYIFYTYMYYSHAGLTVRRLSQPEYAAGGLVALLVFVNGQYYQQQVVGNAYQKDANLQKAGC